tara:strand:+ start:535 stop:654 length:120 start_codon:yes stop_codon:yes gene_type:complete
LRVYNLLIDSRNEKRRKIITESPKFFPLDNLKAFDIDEV